MGRLPTLSRLLLAMSLGILLLSACDDGKKNAPITRREAVVSSAPPTKEPSPTQTTKPPRKPRTLCNGPALDKDFPSQSVGHGEAAGAEVLGTTIRVGHGRWVWLNLWAAWCGPCKEELPRLQSWQRQLSATTDFHYLSLDDDQRQFLRFLQQQPANGLRTSYWLPEGKARGTWLEQLGVEASPELPIQVLVNPRGKVHCVVRGVVEDEDFVRVREIVGGR